MTIDQEHKLFVLSGKYGTTCLGFDVARDRTEHYAAILGKKLPDPMPYGTAEAYALYLHTEAELANSPQAANMTIYDPNTQAAVITVLERCRLNHTRIRFHYGKDGKDWHEEFECEGYISRTAGKIKAPILLSNINSTGGGIILSACIVKIVESKGKRVLYQHPHYDAGKFAIVPQTNKGARKLGLTVAVTIDGQEHASFKTDKQARLWVKKMGGVL